ncbi:VOC family protein [uncultured Aquitalea sp.]|uniref:VOC family protein n=1 Tax=uncultured Aquitalea sp. TaxID=540272 RepID=UPI0025EB3443|nr:VOC family protein [uncultured Aquitalea sp.]
MALLPNLQLLYVRDVARSQAFYEALFDTKASFSSPRYVAFLSDNGAAFALWSGGEAPEPVAPPRGELGLMLEGGDAVDQLWPRWRDLLDVEVVEPLHTAVFGRTFLLRDPDGHLIRVCQRD